PGKADDPGNDEQSAQDAESKSPQEGSSRGPTLRGAGVRYLGAENVVHHPGRLLGAHPALEQTALDLRHGDAGAEPGFYLIPNGRLVHSQALSNESPARAA